jgi:amino acid transporter
MSDKAYHLMEVSGDSNENSPFHDAVMDSSGRSDVGMLEKGDKGDQINAEANPNELVPGRYSFIDALGIVCGIIIGSGIFSSPGLALERAGSPGLTLLAWAMAGGLVILTATCYMELGMMMPNAGGDFEYLKRAYGERAGFAFAWFNFWISKTGSQAIIATIFGHYVNAVVNNGGTAGLGYMYGGEETVFSKLAAAAALVFITLLNCVSVKESAILQNVLTACKLGLVITLFFAAIGFVSSPSTSSETTENLLNNLSAEHSFKGSNNFFSFCTALVACLWSFDGWADLNFMMEELADPNSLPKIIATALTVVTIAYITCNVAYMMLLSQDEMTSSKAIGTDFGTVMGGGDSRSFWPIFISCGVALSTIGSVHGSIMTGGRAFFAVARGGKAPVLLTKLNRIGSPYGALLAQGAWGMVLLMLPGSSFSTLLDYFGPASWFFYSLGSISVIVLRNKEPELERPFMIPFYPLPPILVVVIAISIITSSMIASPFYVVLAFGFIFLSVPFHMAVFEPDSDLYYYAHRMRCCFGVDEQRDT